MAVEAALQGVDLLAHRLASPTMRRAQSSTRSPSGVRPW